jgi:hypothetical protein
MKAAYAVRRTIPPPAEIEEQIENLLAVGVGQFVWDMVVVRSRKLPTAPKIECSTLS